jgi:hypothetical protein
VLGVSAPEAPAPTQIDIVLGKTYSAGNVAGLNFSIGENGIDVSWDPAIEDDWLHTEARIGASFDTATTVYHGKGTAFMLPFQTVGTRTLGVKHFVQGQVGSATPTYVDIVIAAPAVPTVLGVDIMPSAVMVRWSDGKTSQPIKHYIIKLGPLGSNWTTAVEVMRAPKTSFAASLVIPNDGTYKIHIAAEDMAGNIGAVATTEFTVSAANQVIVTASSQVFKVDINEVPDPASINLYAALTGQLSGQTVSWTTVPVGITLTGTGNSRALAYADMGLNDSVKVTASLIHAGTLYEDTTTLLKLRDGSVGNDGLPGIAFVLSNETCTVPALNDGTVTDLSGASTVLTIYSGTQDDTANWIFVKGDTNCHSTIVDNVVTVIEMGPNIVYGPPGPGDLDLDIGDPLPLGANPVDFNLGASYTGSADIAYVDIVAFHATREAQTKRFTIIKAKQGSAGTAFTINATAQFFVLKKDGSITPPSITISTQNGSGTPSYSVIAGTATLTGSGATRTLTPANLVTDFATIQANSAGSIDSITIFKVVEGSDALTVLLSNETHSLPATTAGVVTDYAGASTQVMVLRGATDESTLWSLSKADTNVTSSVSGKTVTVTAMDNVANSGYVDITLSRAGYPDIVRRFTLTKVKQGVAGSASARGNVNIAYAIVGTSWSDAEAAAAISNSGYGVPIIRDVVTLYNTLAGFSETRFYDGAAWLTIAQYLNGNLFVNGTIAGEKMIAETITATQLIKTLALITTEAQIGNLVVNTAAIKDLAVGTLKIQNEAVVVPRFAVGGSGVNVSTETTVLTLPSLSTSRGDGTAGSVALIGWVTITPVWTPNGFEQQGTYPATTTRIKRDSTIIATFTTPYTDNVWGTSEYSHNIALFDEPGDGAHVYTITCAVTAGAADVGSRQILALGVKR